jgi:hypothetical protein
MKKLVEKTNSKQIPNKFQYEDLQSPCKLSSES